jgi:transposase-like protein
MSRPDLNTLACVNPECQWYNQPNGGNLSVRKEYGQDHIRFLRCRGCREEFSERRGTPLFNTKIPEAKAVSAVEHLSEGCGIRPTARLVKVSKETVARLLKATGRQAQRFHDQRVRGIRPQALEFDEQWSFVKKSSGIAAQGMLMRLGTCGTT